MEKHDRATSAKVLEEKTADGKFLRATELLHCDEAGTLVRAPITLYPSASEKMSKNDDIACVSFKICRAAVVQDRQATSSPRS